MTECFSELKISSRSMRFFLRNWMMAPYRPISLAAALVVVVALPSAMSAEAADATAPFKAGFAEKDITPEIGMEQPGGYGKGFHRTLHDPCKVRAAVFDDGQKRVAVVGIDALILHRASVEAVRKRVTEACGIPGDAILIGASHSHSSGPTGMVLPGQFDDAPPLVQKLAYEKSSMAGVSGRQGIFGAP